MSDPVEKARKLRKYLELVSQVIPEDMIDEEYACFYPKYETDGKVYNKGTVVCGEDGHLHRIEQTHVASKESIPGFNSQNKALFSRAGKERK